MSPAGKCDVSAQKASPRTGHPTHDQRADWRVSEARVPVGQRSSGCARAGVGCPGISSSAALHGHGAWMDPGSAQERPSDTSLRCWWQHQGGGCPMAAFIWEPWRWQPVCARVAKAWCCSTEAGAGAQGWSHSSIAPCHDTLPTATLLLPTMGIAGRYRLSAGRCRTSVWPC